MPSSFYNIVKFRPWKTATKPILPETRPRKKGGFSYANVPPFIIPAHFIEKSPRGASLEVGTLPRRPVLAKRANLPAKYYFPSESHKYFTVRLSPLLPDIRSRSVTMKYRHMYSRMLEKCEPLVRSYKDQVLDAGIRSIYSHLKNILKNQSIYPTLTPTDAQLGHPPVPIHPLPTKEAKDERRQRRNFQSRKGPARAHPTRGFRRPWSHWTTPWFNDSMLRRFSTRWENIKASSKNGEKKEKDEEDQQERLIRGISPEIRGQRGLSKIPEVTAEGWGGGLPGRRKTFEFEARSSRAFRPAPSPPTGNGDDATYLMLYGLFRIAERSEIIEENKGAPRISKIESFLELLPILYVALGNPGNCH